MVHLSSAAGAVGTGRGCGHRSVRAGNPVSGRFCPRVRVLLQSRRTEQEEAEARWGDIGVQRELVYGTEDEFWQDI